MISQMMMNQQEREGNFKYKKMRKIKKFLLNFANFPIFQGLWRQGRWGVRGVDCMPF